MKIALVSLAILIAATHSAVAQPEAPAMTQIVDGFYRAYEAFRPPDGVPDANTRSRFQPYLSPQLTKLLTDAADAQARYEKLTKGRFPPLIDGDPFTPNFDGATSYAVQSCVSDAKGAHCRVALTFEGGRDKPRNWIDTVDLVRTEQGWRVNDVDYDITLSAGRGKLSETLESAIAHGDELRQ